MFLFFFLGRTLFFLTLPAAKPTGQRMQTSCWCCSPSQPPTGGVQSGKGSGVFLLKKTPPTFGFAKNLKKKSLTNQVPNHQRWHAKMDAQSERAHVAHTFLHVWAPDLRAQSELINETPASELSREVYQECGAGRVLAVAQRQDVPGNGSQGPLDRVCSCSSMSSLGAEKKRNEGGGGGLIFHERRSFLSVGHLEF